MGAEKAQIETSFREALRIAKQQKSISLAMRAEASHANTATEWQASGLLSNGKGGFLLCLQLGKHRPSPSFFFFGSRQALVPKFNQSLFNVNIAKAAGRFAHSIGSFTSGRVG
jgi:hypothetical protein